MSTDYYKILEVPESASAAEIKKAYRKIAMKYHPDRNQGDKESEEKFKDAAEAPDIELILKALLDHEDPATSGHTT